MVRNKKGSKKIVIAVLVVLLFVLAAVITANSLLTHKPDSSPINYSPPTKEELEAGDRKKEQITNPTTKDQDQEKTGQQQEATVVITDAGQYGDIIEVRSFIPDHYEDGTCLIEFSQNDEVLKEETTAYRDASTTICTNPQINKSEFPKTGEWNVTVTYESTGAYGISEEQKIIIK